MSLKGEWYQRRAQVQIAPECIRPEAIVIEDHDIMSAREREQAKPVHRERRMAIMPAA